MISGPVLGIHDNTAVIEAAGVGYAVVMPATDLRQMPVDGTPVRVHTHLQVREDGLFLYGFLRQRDLEVFHALTSVTRIGPTLAVSVLSQISSEDLVRAIVGEQEQVLVSLSGIGKRNARRLIVELKDTFEKMPTESIRPVPSQGGNDDEQDAVRALIALGFDAKAAFESVSAVSAERGRATAPEIVRDALALMRRGSL
jgi:Holliday junction DNA helicase RuvA